MVDILIAEFTYFTFVITALLFFVETLPKWFGKYKISIIENDSSFDINISYHQKFHIAQACLAKNLKNFERYIKKDSTGGFIGYAFHYRYSDGLFDHQIQASNSYHLNICNAALNQLILENKEAVAHNKIEFKLKLISEDGQATDKIFSLPASFFGLSTKTS